MCGPMRGPPRTLREEDWSSTHLVAIALRDVSGAMHARACTRAPRMHMESASRATAWLPAPAMSAAYDMALAGRFIAAAGRFITEDDMLFFISSKAIAKSICVQTSGVSSLGCHLSPTM